MGLLEMRHCVRLAGWRQLLPFEQYDANTIACTFCTYCIHNWHRLAAYLIYTEHFSISVDPCELKQRQSATEAIQMVKIQMFHFFRRKFASKRHLSL